MGWKMNLRGTVLTSYVVILFCLKGAAASNRNIHGVLGGSAFLDIANLKEQQQILKWLLGKTLIARMKMSDSKPTYSLPCMCELYPNGTLRLDNLTQKQDGQYTVEMHDSEGNVLTEDINLHILENISQPRIKWTCSTKTVTCEVKRQKKPTFQLSQNTEGGKMKEPKFVNDTWTAEWRVKNISGKFKCIVSEEVLKRTTEQQVNCSGLDMFLILTIAGGAIVFVIFVAVLIYCIRKKRSQRRQARGFVTGDEERELQERELQGRIADDRKKQRELPRPPAPIHAPQKQQRQRLPPQCQSQQPPGAPRPKPRTQQKLPNHIKERL